MADSYDFLDQDFQETDLAQKAVPNGEYELALNGGEKKGPNKKGNNFWMLYFGITDGEIPDEIEPEMIKRVSKYYEIPKLSQPPGEIKQALAPWQDLFRALNFDPGMTPREMIESEFSFMEDLIKEERTCWALLKMKNDPQYGDQNDIVRFTTK